MKEGPDITRIAALIGDPARANILTALLSGKALTATELAREAGVTLQTASSHFAKLRDGQLIKQSKQGRHKYFSLANENVAYLLGNIMGLAIDFGHLRTQPGPRDENLRKSRTCYNHLAGYKGVQIDDSFVQRGYLTLGTNHIDLTEAGVQFVHDFGVDLEVLKKGKSPLCRNCLDWSERRSHLAGSLGRALLARIEQLGWAKRVPTSRVVSFTAKGQQLFDETFFLTPHQQNSI